MIRKIRELKAQVKLDDVHLAQAVNHIETFNLEVGVLINFGAHPLNTGVCIISDFYILKGRPNHDSRDNPSNPKSH